MKNIVPIAALSLISPLVLANSTICKLEGDPIGIKALAWDDATFAARVTDIMDNIHDGKVTLVREHKPYGTKTNILIKYQQPYYGADAAEYVVFPVGKNQFRLIGVTYVLNDNSYRLSTLVGNYSAICISM